MKVAINTSPLTSGHAGRGTGVYTKQLLTALKQINVDIFELTNVNDLPSDISLVHYPYFDPFMLTLPLKRQKPTVVTVHDLIPISYPKNFPKGIKGTIKWQIQKHALKSVQCIITDSESSKNEIINLLGFPENKIFVVYLAPAPIFHEQKTQEIERVKRKYRLSEDFLLYVGDVNWNKNIPRLINSLKNLDIQLVLIGKAFLNQELIETQEINNLIKSNNCEKKVVRLGYVSDLDLPAIYTAARVYVQPSIAEGFGLPILEAMACGTPCVVSSKTSLVEIAGPSILVNPLDEIDITNGILKALSIDKMSIKKENINWANNFSWSNVAEKTLLAYKKTLSI